MPRPLTASPRPDGTLTELEQALGGPPGSGQQFQAQRHKAQLDLHRRRLQPRRQADAGLSESLAARAVADPVAELDPIPANFQVRMVRHDGHAWTQVGRHAKPEGNFLLMMGTPDGKLSFRLNFDRFEDAHPEDRQPAVLRFQGTDVLLELRLRLANARGVGQRTLLRSRSRCATGCLRSHRREYGRPRRVLGPVHAGRGSQPTLAMLASQFGGASGNLYKPDVGAVRFAPGRVLHASKSVTTVTPPALESHSGAHKSDQFLTGTPPILPPPDNVHARTRARCASIASSPVAPEQTLGLRGVLILSGDARPRRPPSERGPGFLASGVSCRLVVHLSVQEGHGASTEWRVVPDVSPYVIASVTDLDGVRRLRVAMVGARTRAATVGVANRVLTVAIRLRPGSLPLLTGESARCFVDRGVAVNDVFAPSALSQIELTHDTSQDVIVSELLRLLRRALAGRALAPCLPDRQIKPSATLPHGCTWHRARYGIECTRDLGMSPKRTLRILRLHRALLESWRCGLGGRSSGAGLSAFVAHAAGYADQAHFTREARALLDEAPSAWYARGSAVPFKTSRRA